MEKTILSFAVVMVIVTFVSCGIAASDKSAKQNFASTANKVTDNNVAINALDEQGIANDICDAAMGNDVQKVQELIAKGANVNAKSHYGLTPLQCAVWNGHTKLVKLLIEKGADVNEKLDNNETVLSIAQSKTSPYYPREEILQLLMQAGAKESK